MKLTDLTEVAVWAGISTVVGLAVFGGRTAVSDGVAPVPPQPAATIGHCRVTATGQAPHGKGSAAVKVSIANPGATPQTVAFDVNVIAQRFTGSLVSRVPSANDIQKETIVHRTIRQTIGPASNVSVDILAPSAALTLKSVSNSLSLGRLGQKFKANPTAAPGQLTQTPTTYVVEVGVNGKHNQLAVFALQNA